MNPTTPRLFWLLLAIALAASLTFLAFSLPVADPSPFRQTQTAISAYWMQKDGFHLAYLTPVVGSPWSIPFEFPIYQAIVALISSATTLDLDACGRLVSWAFMLATLLPLRACLRIAGQDPRANPLIAALYLATPLYLLWGSAFMIESTALFLSLCFLYYALKCILKPARGSDLGLLFLFLLLALLQKSTTVLPLLPVLFGLAVWRWQRGQPPTPQALLIWPLAVIAVGIYSVWLHYTDVVKARSIIGSLLTSSALSTWNFGTLAQRVSGKLWGGVLYVRVLAPYLLGLPLLLLRRASFRDDKPLLGALVFLAAATLANLLLFPNLHIHHEYYQYALTLYASVAIGLLLTKAFVEPLGRLDQRLPVLALISLLLFSVGAIKERFWSYNKEIRRTMVVARYIDAATPADEPIIIFGDDWSSEIAYYSRRKAATVPERDNLVTRATDSPRDFVGTLPSAYVVCQPIDELAYVRQKLTHSGYHQATIAYGCFIYLRDGLVSR